MHFKLYLLLYAQIFFIHFSNAFNITTILNKYPSFSIFNSYLSETNVSSEINSRQTITVLAVSNDDIWHLSGTQHDGLDNLMRVHVVLDYFDVQKLKKLNGTTQMTTLFQTTGRAQGQQGFLKVTVSNSGNVVFSSMTSAVPVGAILVNSVAAEPFNISVIHVSTEIVPVGMHVPINSRIDSPTQSPKTPPRRCGPKVAPSLAPKKPISSPPRSPVSSPNPNGEKPPEGAPMGAPLGNSANAPVIAKSPPSVAPKLGPPHSRSQAPSPNLRKESPPISAPPLRNSTIAPASAKLPPAGLAPLGGSINAPPPGVGGVPTGAPPRGSANTPVSAEPPPISMETPSGSPPKLPGTPTEPPSILADADRSGSESFSRSLLVVITIVLSCISLFIQT